MVIMSTVKNNILANCSREDQTKIKKSLILTTSNATEKKTAGKISNKRAKRNLWVTDQIVSAF